MAPSGSASSSSSPQRTDHDREHGFDPTVHGMEDLHGTKEPPADFSLSVSPRKLQADSLHQLMRPLQHLDSSASSKTSTPHRDQLPYTLPVSGQLAQLKLLDVLPSAAPQALCLGLTEA